MTSLLCLWLGLGTILLETDTPPEPPVRWEFNFAVRAWYAEAGLDFPASKEVAMEGMAFAPAVELEGVRNKLALRIFYQFPTNFNGISRNQRDVFAFGVERTDLELSAGWELWWTSLGQGDFLIRGLVGYKRLGLVEDDINTPEVNDDFQRSWEGFYGGLTHVLRGGSGNYWNWDMNVTVAVAELDVQITQELLPGTSYVAPWGYDARGWFYDAVYNLYLPSWGRRDIQWMVGYRMQRYVPQTQTETVLPFRDGVSRPPREEATVQFKATGWITGFQFKF